ncbi:hypothetical protein IG631_04800 [Alternaria alternata]|nr:hypothetical protein IG631_04800 [Alternaria alternata]
MPLHTVDVSGDEVTVALIGKCLCQGLLLRKAGPDCRDSARQKLGPGPGDFIVSQECPLSVGVQDSGPYSASDARLQDNLRLTMHRVGARKYRRAPDIPAT